MSRSPDIRIQTCVGPAILPWLEAVARLRLTVFRDFPYLYDGDMAYEQAYLTTYAQAEHSLVVLALAGDTVVGASTAVPLPDAEAAFQQPFLQRQIPLDTVLYLGESVLDLHYRGLGIGHRFFDAREDHARTLGKTITAFCAVERPAGHPLRPQDYRPLDAFWQQRGYQRQQDMQTRYEWQDIDQPAPDDKTMTFWLRTLDRP